ncbi:hypothetical protein ABB37_08549 [Leptomonas pyrrhocoris]|uniref:Uncharacterized protein n=1 Tax=Leptomonas pyrrhocoris TaxID=157538 RepID=A0A0N0DRW2_LEPPY|nr:hypothetical protein ABB37_08549 [Leptomonas pyrrhocoris]KPA75242.1 hypothetical protein ABB37_08549 [Leptomonas pyrrhocoris]|eukprot:XP_015653681.1 hypothetical protein ABB37_08549 [Leptomonas pyrrhocoris]
MKNALFALCLFVAAQVSWEAFGARGLCQYFCARSDSCSWDTNCKCYMEHYGINLDRPSLFVQEGQSYGLNRSFFDGDAADVNWTDVAQHRFLLLDQIQQPRAVDLGSYWNAFANRYAALTEEVVIPVWVQVLNSMVTTTGSSISHYMTTTRVDQNNDFRGYRGRDSTSGNNRGYCGNGPFDHASVDYVGSASFKLTLTGSIFSVCFDGNGNRYGAPRYGDTVWQEAWSDATCYFYEAGSEMVPTSSNCVGDSNCRRLVNPTYHVIAFHSSPDSFNLDSEVCAPMRARLRNAAEHLAADSRAIGNGDICRNGLI